MQKNTGNTDVLSIVHMRLRSYAHGLFLSICNIFFLNQILVKDYMRCLLLLALINIWKQKPAPVLNYMVAVLSLKNPFLRTIGFFSFF